MAMRWRELKALLIISASLLWQTGERIHSSKALEKTTEYRKLRFAMQEAVESISSSAAALVQDKIGKPVSMPHDIAVRSTNFSQVLVTIWPLYCACCARGVALIQRDRLRNMLRQIGEMANMPIALSLV